MWTPSMLAAPPILIPFALAYLLVAFLPGYTLAELARPRAPLVERVALAVPCAYALVAVFGLATALLHLPFDLLSYAAVAGPLTVLGLWRAWQRRRDRPIRVHTGWWLAPVGVAAVHLAATLWVGRDALLPIGNDTPIHVMDTAMIARTHFFPLTLASSRFGATDGPFYPAAFHGLAALLMDATAAPAYRAAYLSAVAAATFLPLVLFAYVRVALGTERVAALAALAALAFEPLPQFALANGLYPLLVALIFLPALACALREGLWDGDRRAVALAAFLGVGLLYTHPTEAPALVFPLLVVLPTLAAEPRVWARAARHGAVLTAVWGAAALPALAYMHRAVAGAAAGVPSHLDLANAVTATALDRAIPQYIVWIYGRNVSYALLLAVIVGCAWCLVRRRHRGLVVAQLLLTLLFIDSNGHGLARALPLLSFHWTWIERLAPLHYWIALPLAAVGIDAMGRLLGWLGARRSLALPARALIVAPCIALGLVLPFGVSGARMTAFTARRTIVAPADLGALSWLARHAPPRTTVLNDADMTHPATLEGAIDAAFWLPVLGGPQPIFFRDYEGVGTLSERFDALAHIASQPWPAATGTFVRQARIGYVYYGAHVAPGAPRHLMLARLLAAPDLRLVYTSAPACGDAHGPAACPPTAVYVFAVRPVLRPAVTAQKGGKPT